MKLQQLFNDRKFVIPDFQRDFVWEHTQQIQCLATYLSFLPINSFLVLKGKGKDFCSRRSGFPDGSIDLSKDTECTYLLDGQQRYTTLISTFSNIFGAPGEWDANFGKMYSKLRRRIFLTFPGLDDSLDDDDDVFGYKQLKFDYESLRSVLPESIEEYLEAITVRKKDKEKWYHPAKAINHEFIINAQKNKKVPLFLFFEKDGKETIKSILKGIAQERLLAIRDRIYCRTDPLFKLHDVSKNNCSEDNYRTQKDADICSDWAQSIYASIKNAIEQEIPAIEFSSADLKRVIPTFTLINKGGTPLTNFDLVVAKAATDGTVKLTNRIIDCLKTDFELPPSLSDRTKTPLPLKWNAGLVEAFRGQELVNKTKNDFLNLLGLFHKYPSKEFAEKIHTSVIKEESILHIISKDINKIALEATTAISRAYAFLQTRCGVIKSADLSYSLLTIPLACLLYKDEIWKNETALRRLEYWYWVSLFGGAYQTGQNERCLNDLVSLYTWGAKSGWSSKTDPFEKRKRDILNVSNYCDEEILTRKNADFKIPAAIHNGLLQYILSTQPTDFLPKESYDPLILTAWDVASGKEIEAKQDIIGKQRESLKFSLDSLQDHHIMPLGSDPRMKIGTSTKSLRADPSNELNSTLNRTIISSKANSIISDWDLCRYKNDILSYALQTHFVGISSFGRSNKDIMKERYQLLLNNIKEECEILLK